ncbi:nitroreductase family protein [Nocardia sp. NPDC057668]|uniref:nitroreductase family protein n=1 Tax=Nocardia sp. NPDC057668 TaxID=3346202 RepID=UPI0036707F9A
MGFSEVLRQRRMAWNYTHELLSADVIDRVVSAALRAPSAGFSQGSAFLVLTLESDRERFWKFAPHAYRANPAIQNAPMIIVPMSNKNIYLDRYAEEDKEWTDRDEACWPAPYWHIDTGMAAFAMLLTAVDGLGACFLVIMPRDLDRFRAEFGVPADYHPIGAITVGYRAEGQPSARLDHRCRKAADVVHDGFDARRGPDRIAPAVYVANPSRGCT